MVCERGEEIDIQSVDPSLLARLILGLDVQFSLQVSRMFWPLAKTQARREMPTKAENGATSDKVFHKTYCCVYFSAFKYSIRCKISNNLRSLSSK